MILDNSILIPALSAVGGFILKHFLAAKPVPVPPPVVPAPVIPVNPLQLPGGDILHKVLAAVPYLRALMQEVQPILDVLLQLAQARGNSSDQPPAKS